ncbi:hypothetical protein DFH09DRAFT_1103159 [Mycena vulgaris]|nr:hypothetical protein DFH09DRAFT_1103159 [Mycena vulgaris]
MIICVPAGPSNLGISCPQSSKPRSLRIVIVVVKPTQRSLMYCSERRAATLHQAVLGHPRPSKPPLRRPRLAYRYTRVALDAPLGGAFLHTKRRARERCALRVRSPQGTKTATSVPRVREFLFGRPRDSRHRPRPAEVFSVARVNEFNFRGDEPRYRTAGSPPNGETPKKVPLRFRRNLFYMSTALKADPTAQRLLSQPYV